MMKGADMPAQGIGFSQPDPVPAFGSPMDTALGTIFYVLPGLAFAFALHRMVPSWNPFVRALLSGAFPLLFWPICIHLVLYFSMPNDDTFFDRMKSLFSTLLDGAWLGFVPGFLLIVIGSLLNDRSQRSRAEARRFADYS